MRQDRLLLLPLGVLSSQLRALSCLWLQSSSLWTSGSRGQAQDSLLLLLRTARAASAPKESALAGNGGDSKG